MGEIIGDRYRIIRSLGRGGMGEVFLAEDVALGGKAALKCVGGDLPAGEARSRFRREALAASWLDHPNICRIFEIVPHGEKEYIVMQYVDGVTLLEPMKIKSLALGQIVGIALQITEGMMAAQARHIVHLDIKPANIMIDKSGRVKILDFGLAEFRPRNTADRKTRRPGPGSRDENVVMGTMSYMSPEQAQGLDPDVRSDIFSFGVVLYELLEGENPFADPDSVITLFNIRHKQIRFVREVPQGLREIILKTLRKDRECRYQDFREIKKDLLALPARMA